jgi:hypothetical protein
MIFQNEYIHSIRIGSCALADILSHTPNVPADANMPQYQQEDLAALGRLLFQLMTLNPSNTPNFKALEALSRTYSPDLKNVLLWCLGSAGKPGMPRTAAQLLEIVGAGRVAREMEEAARYVCYLRYFFFLVSFFQGCDD